MHAFDKSPLSDDPPAATLSISSFSLTSFLPKYDSFIVFTLVLKSSSFEYSTSSASLLNFSLAVSFKSSDVSSMMSCLFNSRLLCLVQHSFQLIR